MTDNITSYPYMFTDCIKCFGLFKAGMCLKLLLSGKLVCVCAYVHVYMRVCVYACACECVYVSISIAQKFGSLLSKMERNIDGLAALRSKSPRIEEIISR